MTAYTEELSPSEVRAIFHGALAGTATAADAQRFTGHMLIELARIKSQRIASQQASLVSNLKQVWLDIREAFRNAFHILGSDAKMIGQHLRSWGSTPSAGATRA